MNNYELNMAIAEKLGIYSGFDHASISQEGVTLINNDSADYCNDWNDLMPLVIEHDLRYDKVVDTFIVSTMFCQYEVSGKNLQRALAECLLKVLESK